METFLLLKVSIPSKAGWLLQSPSGIVVGADVVVSIPSKAGWLLQLRLIAHKAQVTEGFNPLKGGVVVAI